MTKPPKKKPSARAQALQQFLRSVGDRAADLQRKTDIPYTTIHSFLIGKTQKMDRDTEIAISRAYGLDIEEVFGGAVVSREITQAQPRASESVLVGKDHFWPVPVYDIRAAAGAGALVEDGDPTTYQMFRDQFLQRVTRAPITALSVIYVSGDSMWDTLHEGDTILVDRSETRVVKDGIYVLRLEDGLLVKRCSRRLADGSVMITSDNPKYPPQTVENPRDLDVIGRVIWIGRALG